MWHYHKNSPRRHRAYKSQQWLQIRIVPPALSWSLPSMPCCRANTSRPGGNEWVEELNRHEASICVALGGPPAKGRSVLSPFVAVQSGEERFTVSSLLAPTEPPAPRSVHSLSDRKPDGSLSSWKTLRQKNKTTKTNVTSRHVYRAFYPPPCAHIPAVFGVCSVYFKLHGLRKARG